MRTTLFISLFSLIYIQLFSQTPVYSFDENLEVPNPSLPQMNMQSGVFERHDNLIENTNWSRGFSVPGIIGYIYATATDGDNLYIGGNFSIAGGIVANSIVKWDGKKWTSLGEGPENGVGGEVPSVEAIAVADGKVFIGGQFRFAGSEKVNGVAYWDGIKWNKLGNDSTNGVRRMIYLENDTLIQPGFVYSLFANKNTIFLGGYFNYAGVTQSRGVAAWDMETKTWVDMEGGLSSQYEDNSEYAYDFAAWENSIYVGGKFNIAGEVAANNIARWDSTGWSAIGNAYGYVYDLEFDISGSLYATGYFPANDSSGSSGVGKWDGEQWTSIAGPEGLTSYVNRVKIYQDGFFAGGYFESDTVIPGVGLAQWDGNNWKLIRGLGQSSNEFQSGGISGIEIINERMYVTGNFTKSGSSYPVNIAEWDLDNSTWKLLDDGSGNQGIYDGYIYTLAENGESLYAGGSFTVAGGVYVKNIAKWTGTAWQPVGQNFENGIRGSVYTILLDKDVLYAGGYFGSAGSTVAFHIAMWDGSKWSSVGIGVGGVPGAYVSALAKIGNYLYVGGYFSAVGDEENYEIPANSIARFDLTTNRWETLGRGIEYVYGIPGRVYALTADGNKLYVGGEFHSADDKNFDNFAVLVDNKWAGIDGYEDIGIDGWINTIKVINDEIYIGGQLITEFEGSTYGILKWDDKKWIPAGGQQTIEGEDVFVHDIEPYGDGFIAGGLFPVAGNNEVNNIAYFDGHTWNEIGGGIWPGVGELAIAGDKLFVAGPRELFTAGFPNASLASYNLSVPTKNENIPAGNGNQVLWNYPNPFQLKTTIWYNISVPGNVRLSLFDARGREVAILLDDHRNAGTYEVELNKGTFPAGIYVCRMIRGNSSVTTRIVVLE